MSVTIWAVDLRTESDRVRAQGDDIGRAGSGIGFGGTAFALLPTYLLGRHQVETVAAHPFLPDAPVARRVNASCRRLYAL